MLHNGNALTTQGNDVFDAIWGNATLRGNLWTDIPANPNNTTDKLKYQGLFKDIVSNTSNSFFDFIKVK